MYQPGTMKIFLLGLVVVFFLCLDGNVCKESQEEEENDEPENDEVWFHFGTDSVKYCQRDFECSKVCGPYFKASDKCSCHPACKVFNDCCYDTDNFISACSQQNSDDINIMYDIILKYKQYFQCTTDLISKEKYWMVSKCPDAWGEPNECDIINQTTPITVGRVEDGMSAIPVVSPDGVTFRNFYCAFCHGENLETVAPWSFEFEYEDADTCQTYSNLSASDEVRYLIDNCDKVSFLPPSELRKLFPTVIPCRELEQDVIDVCEDPTENSTVAENCSLVAAPVEFNGTTYKNKFCLDCNLKDDIKSLCLNTVFSGHILNGTIAKGGSHLTTSMQFEFGGQTACLSISGKCNVTSICEAGQVFDPLESKCVHLACPDGYRLEKTVCVQQPFTDIQDSGYCPRFAIDVTVGYQSNSGNSCSFSLEHVIECLPEDLMILFEENLKYDNASCQSKNSSQFLFQTFTSSVDVINGILSAQNDVNLFSSQMSQFCSSVDVIKILAYCSPSQSDLEFECGSWLNETQWQFLENSTGQISIEDTSEFILVSEIKIRSYFKLSGDDNRSRDIEVAIMRCNLTGREMTSCPLLTLNSSFFESEKNGSGILIYKKNTSVRLAPDMYKLYPNGSIQVCNFLEQSGTVYYNFLPEYSLVEAILSTVGLSLSVVALSFTLLTYSVFPELRSRMVNILIMILCVCLLPAQILLIFSGLATVLTEMCAAVSGLGHFLWLSVFTTTSVLGFAFSQTFSLRKQVTRGRKPSWKTVFWLSLICFGPPTLISGTMLVFYFMDVESFNITYGSSSGCWIGGPSDNLIFFGIPVAVCLLVNLGFFLRVTLSIFKQMRSSGRVRKGKKGFKLHEALIYVKIFLILGLTWIFGFLAAATNIQILWYVFTVLTSLQGVFIFLSFTVKFHIWRLWGKKFGLVSSDVSSGRTQSRSKRTYDEHVPKNSTDSSLHGGSTTAM